MNKLAFLTSLREALHDLPQEELEQTIQYYSESIDDRMEDGASEEEAVLSLGSADTIAAQIRAEDTPEKKKFKPELKGWHIALIIIGAPVWAGLLGGIISTIAGLGAGLIAMFAGLYGAAGGVAAGGVGCLVVFIRFLIQGSLWPAAAYLGACLFCAGAAIALFMATNALLRLAIRLIKQGYCALKARLPKKGAAQ